jgi:hypothetical protein
MVRIKELLKAVTDNPDFQKRMAAQPVKNETAEEKAEREELDRLYRFIGLYVIIFQQVEAELDQIILLVVGQDRWHVGQSIVTLLSNSAKIDLIQSIVKSSALSSGSEAQQEWLKSFDHVLQELRSEGAQRNKIVHSIYLFDFMKVGAPPLQSKRRKKKGELDFEQAFIDADHASKAVGRISELAFDVGMLRTQLIHWHDDVSKSKFAAR